ncbi:MAG: hypothetical protein GTN38_01905 [Candidatus Aenigmarchaeota archaeon]|nr:hypothetical protein [Candidatus Aenigmarchaeota archaeon]NIP40310.1 hypothetical protein [Candidatus Aenigmarchaeota archaeon]NIQ17802.1 hypothetical protein [Candidatus Aenigmarchaeota archaeon]NIS73185.1 hypothetical protein [Candidatus Aenigmarchaeota archaeon]
MDKKILVLAVFLIIAIGLVIPMAIAKPDRAKKACSDGSDNDGDSYIDYPDDPGCANKNDNSELNPAIECDDGNDNDGDEAIDYNDGGCTGPTDDDETNCGDDVCEGGEDCDTCAADCLQGGQVCCDGIAYMGDCCDNNDCTSPEVCHWHTCGPPDSCSDTDGGFVVTVQGTASGYLNGIPYSNTDFCDFNITTTLIEFYCVGDQCDLNFYDCTMNFTSCSNGACV